MWKLNSMGVIRVHNRQSIFDTVLQATGGISAVVDVMTANGMAMNDALGIGQELVIGDVEDSQVYGYYQQKKIIPVSSDGLLWSDTKQDTSYVPPIEPIIPPVIPPIDEECCTKFREVEFGSDTEFVSSVTINYGDLEATKMVVSAIIGRYKDEGKQRQFSNRDLQRYEIDYDLENHICYISFIAPARGVIIFLTN